LTDRSQIAESILAPSLSTRFNTLSILRQHLGYTFTHYINSYLNQFSEEHTILSCKQQLIVKETKASMLSSAILVIVTAFVPPLAIALPLHNTNAQRLPDQPAITVEQTDHPSSMMIQKHKPVPEIAAQILQLCSRSLGY